MKNFIILFNKLEQRLLCATETQSADIFRGAPSRHENHLEWKNKLRAAPGTTTEQKSNAELTT